MLGKLLVVVTLTAFSGAAHAVATRSCGQARADLKICLVSGGTPTHQVNYVALSYASGENYSLNAQTQANAGGQGINHVIGSGVVRRSAMQILVRVDFTPTYLPVHPGYPPTATVFYRNAPGSQWLPVPGTGSFPLKTEF